MVKNHIDINKTYNLFDSGSINNGTISIGSVIITIDNNVINIANINFILFLFDLVN